MDGKPSLLMLVNVFVNDSPYTSKRSNLLPNALKVIEVVIFRSKINNITEPIQF
jgi:hypothetical protein